MEDRAETVERGLQPQSPDHVKHFTRLALHVLFRKLDLAERLVEQVRDHAHENGEAVTPDVQRVLDEWELLEVGA